MNQFGSLYSQYYDLLYNDKDYAGETEYIDKLVKFLNKDARTILDLGCGTGRHAELLCNKGYFVYGVDRSKDMLEFARKRIKENNKDRLILIHSTIQDLSLEKKFDVIISLFHVMSYQNSNDELIKTFEVCKNHLVEGGLFIFDFWYGPAVLTNLPSIRVKRLENDSIKVTRIAEPIIKPLENVVEVHYDIFIENKYTKEIVETKEIHRMRYFFDTELELICKMFGFKILHKYEWMTYKTPDLNSWSVVWIVKN